MFSPASEISHLSHITISILFELDVLEDRPTSNIVVRAQLLQRFNHIEHVMFLILTEIDLHS